jgi:hypothetical protein
MFKQKNRMAVSFLRFNLFLLMCVLLFCQNNHPAAVTAEQFQQWFVGTTDRPPERFFQVTESEIDSFCRYFRCLSQPESGCVVLSDTTGKPYSVGYRTPHTFRHDSTYPCIIYLHGGTGTSLTNKGELAYEMLDMLTDSMKLFLVSPSANREALWWSAAGLSRILQTLRYMTLHFPINPDKVFLVGVSDGATGC